jgi:hypothetical protein
MAPKLTKCCIDAKLDELRQFVRENQEILSARRGTTLVKSLRQLHSVDEKRWHWFLSSKAARFDQEQAEHLKHTFALLGPVSAASTAAQEVESPMHNSGVSPHTVEVSVVTSLSGEEAKSPKQNSGVLPHTADASSAASLSGQVSETRHGTKRAASGPSEQNAESTTAGSKRRKAEGENRVTVFGAQPLAVKRKSGASGANPPNRRPRTDETDETVETTKSTPTAENRAELLEFEAWLQVPQAMRIRKEHIQKDRQVVKDLLVHPPTRATVQSVAVELGVRLGNNRGRGGNKSAVSLHGECVRAALQNFRRWRTGSFAAWMQEEPEQALPGCSSYVQPLAKTTQA